MNLHLPLWFSNLLFWSAQVSLVTLAAAALVRILRILQPGALLAQWRVLLAVSLLLPVLQPWHRQAVLAGPDAAPELPFSRAVPALMPPVNPHWQFPSLTAIAEILGLVILLGIAVRFVFFVLGLLKLQQLRRASLAIPPGSECSGVLEQARTLVGAQAEFRVSVEVDSPVTFGFSAPAILLPERFLQLDVQSQAAVACHELLHVHRRDWLHHLIEEILRVGLWFHPAILWLVARIRLSREQVVDLEVIKRTQARKSYLKALLEFANGRRVTAVPAPPFLGERQLIERVSLMLKEVRMSRTRLVVSLSAVTLILGVVGVFAVSVFPLKASLASPLQDTPFVAPLRGASLASKPVVAADSIWTDRVRRGTMPVQVSGGGTLIPGNNSARLVAEVLISGYVQDQVRLKQSALVRTNKGIVKGHVQNLGPTDANGNRWVDIGLDSPLPPGIAANTTVDTFVTVSNLENVLYIDRPTGQGFANAAMPLFKIIDHGERAVRVEVGFGHSNMNAVQVVSGLSAGDMIVLSDMSPYNRFASLQIKH